MIIASCRENQTATTKFSNTLFLSEPLPIGKKVFVAVHGYHANYDDTKAAYEMMEQKLAEYRPGDFDSVVGFFWPGSWSVAVGFLMAERRTKKAATYLAELVSALINNGNLVTLEGHSLGCKVVLQSLSSYSQFALRKFILAAPAVDSDMLSKIFPNVAPFQHGVIAYSERDPVLKVGYRLVPYNWFSPAMGLAGPKRPYPSVIETKDFSTTVDSHSGYRKVTEFYQCL